MVVASERVVLASASARRRSLLEKIFRHVDVRPPDSDETWPGGDPAEAAISIARRKYDQVGEFSELAVAADTVVCLDQKPLGKPTDVKHAQAMLRELSGRSHRVITGFCVGRAGQVESEAVATEVTFRPLSTYEIENYVATGEPMDKAGSYGIQGEGGAFVDCISGSYTNVVGLPLPEVLRAIARLA